MKNYIGRVTYFDEHLYKQAEGQWQRNILPKLGEVQKQYSILDIGALNQESFEEILSNGFALTEQKFESRFAHDLAIFKTDIFRDDFAEKIAGVIAKFKESWTTLISTHFSAQSRGTFETIPVYIEDILIVDGLPIFNAEKVKSYCQMSIKTKEQNLFYNEFLVVQEHWERMRQAAILGGFNIGRWLLIDQPGASGPLYEDKEGNLQLNPKFQNWLPND